jgi:hypothetical protein
MQPRFAYVRLLKKDIMKLRLTAVEGLFTTRCESRDANRVALVIVNGAEAEESSVQNPNPLPPL